MCGIAGYIGREKLSDDLLEMALGKMDSRGPDAHGVYKYESKGLYVYLLHKRLSILDLDSRSNQPFKNGKDTLVFNGEIYNYKEVRKQLETKGVRFVTSSDTEVLSKALAHFGTDAMDLLEGMWSFATFNETSETLILSRDRFGEKPLYTYQNDSGCYFASETRTLRTIANRKFEINYDQLKRLLVNGHKSLYKQKASFYQGIDEIDLATNIRIGRDLTIRKFKFWRPSFSSVEMSEKDAISGIRQRLIQSVEYRLRSDVPLAFCLSGGVDSSSLVSIAAKELGADVNTFSIVDQDKRYNEYDNIQETIKDTGCSHHLIELDPKQNYLDKLKELVQYHDAPVATISYLVHSFLSEKIHEKGYKIAISGTGADELFTGYYDHFNLHFQTCRNESNFNNLLRDWKKHQFDFIRHPSFRKYDLYFNDSSIRDHIYLNNDVFASYLIEPFSERFSEVNYSNDLLRNRMMNEMFHEVVRVILHEDDLNSMKYSIENRSPFLDRNLFDYANSIPSKFLIKNGYAKYLLRESMQGILNDKVRLSREKKGFNASINSIIDFDNSEHIHFILEDSPVYELVDRKKIIDLIKRKEFTNSFEKFLFNFINVKLFLEIEKV